MTEDQMLLVIDKLANSVAYYADENGEGCPDINCNRTICCDYDSDKIADCWKQCAINFVVNGTWRVDLEGCKR